MEERYRLKDRIRYYAYRVSLCLTLLGQSVGWGCTSNGSYWTPTIDPDKFCSKQTLERIESINKPSELENKTNEVHK